MHKSLLLAAVTHGGPVPYGNAQQGSSTANGGPSPPTATGVYGVNPASRGPYGAPSASAAGYGGPAQNHGTALPLCLWEAFCQGHMSLGELAC